MNKTRLLIAALLVLSVAYIVPAGAQEEGDFSPQTEFELSDTKVKGNPEVSIHVEQDADEEELAHVTLNIPKGFKLPKDADIDDGTELGSGEIVIAAGPGCHPSSPLPVTVPLNVPAGLEERDRSDEQEDRGVYAVWFLDISGVTSIELEITGSKKKGWKVDGDIPANDFTCPPFSFDLTVNDKAGDVPIYTNAAKPKTYIFAAIFSSADSPKIAKIEQPIRLTK
jgi:hypothetical protein